MWILELDDTDIRLSKDGEIVHQEPGIAWADVKKLSFGVAALNVAKLYPARVHTQYWNLMDQSNVEPKGYAVETQADLVYQQLLHIKESGKLSDNDKVLMLVPSDRTELQLRLLYGIVLKTGLKLVDFVDLGVAGVLAYPGQDSVAFIDVGMQRTVITHLSVGERAVRERVSVTPQLGLLPLMNTWIRMVAEKFLEISRFDPRKFAETEQQIFDQILAFVRSDKDNTAIEAAYKGFTRQIEIAKAEIIEAAQDRYAAATSYLNQDEDVVMSSSTQTLPGLSDSLIRGGHKQFNSTFSTMVEALTHSLGEDLNSDECTLHTSLVKQQATFEEGHRQERVQTDWSNQPTHVLHQATAYPIGPEYIVNSDVLGETLLFTLQKRSKGTALKIGTSAPISVNGTLVRTELLVHTGDCISVRDQQYELIKVQG